MDKTTKKGKLSKRNLWLFSLGTFGRDIALAGFFMNNVLNYIYTTKQLDDSMIIFLTVYIALEKIFDAVNDVFMGNILDATKTKWGKFKPWILIGMIGCIIIILFVFNSGLDGWEFLIFFAIFYLLFDIFFTMNDTAYWGYLPTLGRDIDDRNKITSIACICAGFGQGACGLLVPLITVGAMSLGTIVGYRFCSIAFCIILVLFQSLTLFVKEDELKDEVQVKDEKIGIKETINVIKGNDQLRWVVLAFFATQIIPAACLNMFIWFQFGYEGIYGTLIYALSAVVSMACNVFYPSLAHKFSRKKMMFVGMLSGVIGYGLLILFFFIIPNTASSINIPILNVAISLQFLMMIIANTFCGFGSTSMYLSFVIAISNTCEYNEVKTGKRNEGVIFSTRAFAVKLGSAVQTAMVMIIYLICGVYDETNKISRIENDLARGLITDTEKTASIQNVIDSIEPSKTAALLIILSICGIVFYFIAYLIFSKKYKIDEEYFTELTNEIERRKSNQN